MKAFRCALFATLVVGLMVSGMAPRQARAVINIGMPICHLAFQYSTAREGRDPDTGAPIWQRTDYYSWICREVSPHGGSDDSGGSGAELPAIGGHFIPNQGDLKPATTTTTAARNAAIATNCNRAGSGGSSDPTDSPTNGDPVVLATGNEIMPETDFQSAGQMGLSLTRTYDYYWNGIGIFGRRWLSDYDYKLLFTTHDPASPCYTRPGNTPCDPTGQPIWALRPDGRLIKYNYSTTPAPGWYEDKPSPIAKILKTGTTYTLYGADHTVETYDSHGFPVTINNRQGQGWTFTYDANDYLIRVTSSSGRYVDFGWSNGLLTTVSDPAGNVYHYSYTTIPVSTDSMTTQSLSPMLRNGDPVDDPPPLPPDPPIQSMVALLTSATQPGTQGGAPSTLINYHYEDSRFITALTGKSINGHRYSWITYNAQAMVSETHLANSIEDYQFAYALDSNGHITQTTVTNSLGRQTSYSFDANGNRTAVAGATSLNCPMRSKELEYDANGYLSRTTDFNGTVTLYTYDPNGELLKKVVDPASLAQTVQYTWDAVHNQPKTIELVGDHTTTFHYDSINRLSAVTVTNDTGVGEAQNQVRTTHTTTFAYTTWPNGLVKTQVVDGPLTGSGDALTLTFSQAGDLLSQQNGLGHATTYGNYNALGEPGYVIGPNGARRDFMYDARGRVVDVETHRNGGTQHTGYQYDAYGKLARVTQPNGHTMSYQYDMAGRLTAKYEPEGDGTFDETAYTYNAMSLPTKVTQQRVFSEPQEGTVP